MKIIGIVGFAGSGKSTVADILVNTHSFHSISFADGVKDATSAIFGWPRDLLEGDTVESREFRETESPYWTEKFGFSVTPRKMMQIMGTEAGRQCFHPDIWIHRTFNVINAWSASGIDRVVIPDVRFGNEIEEITNQSGILIRVRRGPEPEWYELALRANDNKDPGRSECAIRLMEKNIHYSEWAWISHNYRFDHIIENDGTVEDLQKKVAEIINL